MTKRNRGRNVRAVMQKVKVFLCGWLGYYYVAKRKQTLQRRLNRHVPVDTHGGMRGRTYSGASYSIRFHMAMACTQTVISPAVRFAHA